MGKYFNRFWTYKWQHHKSYKPPLRYRANFSRGIETLYILTINGLQLRITPRWGGPMSYLFLPNYIA
jgi:hypothetical protein